MSRSRLSKDEIRLAKQISGWVLFGIILLVALAIGWQFGFSGILIALAAVLAVIFFGLRYVIRKEEENEPGQPD